MLELTDLSGGYGEAGVVRGVTTRVAAGEIVALVGRNGMGKSTLLRTVFGLADRQGGTVVFDGRPVPAGRPHQLARRGAALLPEDRGVFPSLSIADNLKLAARKDYRPAVDPHDVYPLLAERAGQPAGTLSGGQKQQLGIARAMLSGRSMIVVDELTQGLQPSVVHDTLDALTRLAAAGIAILLVDQHAGLLVEHCHRALVMESGRIVLDAERTAETGTRIDELLAVR